MFKQNEYLKCFNSDDVKWVFGLKYHKSADIILEVSPELVALDVLAMVIIRNNVLRTKTPVVNVQLLILCKETDHSYDILAITETWLNEDTLSDAFVIEGYRLWRKDRQGRGGGIGFYLKNSIQCRVMDFQIDDTGTLEYMWKNQSTLITNSDIEELGSRLSEAIGNIFIPMFVDLELSEQYQKEHFEKYPHLEILKSKQPQLFDVIKLSKYSNNIYYIFINLTTGNLLPMKLFLIV
nr:unnamed protein product [Callosobruchus analis]